MKNTKDLDLYSIPKNTLYIVNMKKSDKGQDHQYGGTCCNHITIPDRKLIAELTLLDYFYIDPDWWYNQWYRNKKDGKEYLIPIDEVKKVFKSDYLKWIGVEKESEYIEQCKGIQIDIVFQEIVDKVNQILGTHYKIDHNFYDISNYDNKKYKCKPREAFIPLRNNLAIIWQNCD